MNDIIIVTLLVIIESSKIMSTNWVETANHRICMIIDKLFTLFEIDKTLLFAKSWSCVTNQIYMLV